MAGTCMKWNGGISEGSKGQRKELKENGKGKRIKEIYIIWIV
jgi:hypothetical protein